MPAAAVPERIRWAVETLAVKPTDRLLEIGCGGGVAVALLCPRLSTGRIVAIDRSETATARARRRNDADVRAGRATIRTVAFRPADISAVGLDSERFDTIFAINVNLFWTGPARDELALVRRLLAPGGAVYLCYEPPRGRGDEITGKVTSALAASGFSVTTRRSASLAGIAGRPA
ncbi:class I SAM-dependent methyltransferase [Micromonospora sp. NPDC051296]|uniref:SAM-dependent methyltransferase n=1 Tax=Micromonospora sp. NPDC051296 TaxID=3155046 RepID=UPI00342D349F